MSWMYSICILVYMMYVVCVSLRGACDGRVGSAHIQYPGEYGWCCRAGERAEAGEWSGSGVYLLRSSEDAPRLASCEGGIGPSDPPKLLLPPPGTREVGGAMGGPGMRRRERGVGGDPSLRTPRPTWFSSLPSTRFILARLPCRCPSNGN